MTEVGNQANMLSAGEIATRLGVSMDTARRMIQRRELEGGCTLGRWWATLESVERYLREQTSEPAA